jgi:hypothetical protein
MTDATLVQKKIWCLFASLWGPFFRFLMDYLCDSKRLPVKRKVVFTAGGNVTLETGAYLSVHFVVLRTTSRVVSISLLQASLPKSGRGTCTLS